VESGEVEGCTGRCGGFGRFVAFLIPHDVSHF
jgi:hypothetical protein